MASTERERERASWCGGAEMGDGGDGAFFSPFLRLVGMLLGPNGMRDKDSGVLFIKRDNIIGHIIY